MHRNLYATVAILAGLVWTSAAGAAEVDPNIYTKPPTVQFARFCTLGNGTGGDFCDLTREVIPSHPDAGSISCIDREAGQMKHGKLLTWRQAELVASKCPSLED